MILIQNYWLKCANKHAQKNKLSLIVYCKWINNHTLVKTFGFLLVVRHLPLLNPYLHRIFIVGAFSLDFEIKFILLGYCCKISLSRGGYNNLLI